MSHGPGTELKENPEILGHKMGSGKCQICGNSEEFITHFENKCKPFVEENEPDKKETLPELVKRIFGIASDTILGRNALSVEAGNAVSGEIFPVEFFQGK